MKERKRIYFREFMEIDWEAVHEYASQEIVCQYQPWGPNTIEESQAFVKEVLEDAEKKPRLRFTFAVVFKEDGKMIGAGELAVKDTANRAGEIGYIINPAYWGKGIATEVAEALTEFGFTEKQLHRLYATCDPRNIASQKVLGKIGMVQEGRMRDALHLKDGWRDSLLYSLLEHEWKNIKLNY